jgi:uncharacterized protein (DUF305 family)
MKTRTLALAGTSLALTVLLAACGSTTANSPEASAPAGTSAAVAQTVGEATDADISFAQLMIPHHQQAVEMADLALARETSPEVKELAEQIQGAQDPEIQMMSGWLEAWGAPMEMGDDHGSHDMGGMTMSGMMSDEDMQALADATGADFDTMWLEMMIAHHEGAISMADQVKAESINAEVIALADAVISGQTAEIDTMTQLLAS